MVKRCINMVTIRYRVFCLFLCFVLTLSLDIDEETRQWVIQTVTNTSNETNDSLDLTPTGINVLPSRFDQEQKSTQSPANNLTPMGTNQDVDCQLESGENGVCVPYYLCDPNSRNVITDGAELIDTRGKTVCSSYLDVCCRNSDQVQVALSTILSKPVNKPQEDDVNFFNNLEASGSSKGCGWSNRDVYIFKPDEKTDDSKYADFGEYPWMVAVLKKRDQVSVWTLTDFIGGGAIIHPSVVITAAHKINNLANTTLKCRGGEYDTQRTDERYPFQERDVKKRTIHPDFYATSAYNDVALLFLEQPFDLSPTIAPHMGIACLGQTLPPPHTKCFSMGWGKEFLVRNKYAVVLKKVANNFTVDDSYKYIVFVKLDILDHDTCQSLLRKQRLGPFFELHESLTCAGGVENIDTCQGDGGSPLVCRIEGTDGNRYAVYGLVAYGLNCGKKDSPGVYVNIPNLYDWVDNQMSVEKLDKPFVL